MTETKAKKKRARRPVRQSEVGNQHGYLCPSCGKGTRLYIQAVIRTEVALYPDGTEDSGGDTEWENSSAARCSNCDWHGTVARLKTVTVEGASERYFGSQAAAKRLETAGHPPGGFE